MLTHIQRALAESASALSRLQADRAALDAMAAAAEAIAGAAAAGGRIFACGNGGSMCDAMHFAEELTGRFRDDRRPIAAVAISDPGYLSCTANDYGYDEVFARYLVAHGRTGDVLLAISTSGASANVVRAADRARDLGLHVIALTGRAASPLASSSDITICTPAGQYSDRVQELHIKVIHILIELVERRLFPGQYAGSS